MLAGWRGGGERGRFAPWPVCTVAFVPALYFVPVWRPRWKPAALHATRPATILQAILGK